MSTRQSDAPPPPPHLMGVLRSLWQWRKPILNTTIAGAVLAIIISLLLPVYYQATTSFVAINPEQNSIDGIFGNQSGRIRLFGDGNDIDRLLAVAESDELVDYMIKTFGLYTVYDIDSTATRAPLKVHKEFLDNFEVEKSARDIISLHVEDQDPHRAADMANTARERINHIAAALSLSPQKRAMHSLQEEIQLRDQTLQALNDSLRNLRERTKVYNATAQSVALAEATNGLAGSISNTRARIGVYRTRGSRPARDSIAKLEVKLAGLERAKITTDSQLYQLNANLGTIINLEDERERLSEAVTYDRLRLKQLQALLRNDQRVLEVVEAARPPIIKSRPVRSLIVAGSTIFCFIVAVVGALLIQSSRRYNWSGIFR